MSRPTSGFDSAVRPRTELSDARRPDDAAVAGAAAVALVVALASSGGRTGASGLLAWDTAAVACGVLCLVAALIAAACRPSTAGAA